MQANYFQIADYIIFFITLCISSCIGIYFGCFGTKQKTAKEYLYANRNMKPVPVGLSLYSSAISTIAVLGIPTEVYIFGSQYFIVAVGSLTSLIITWNFVLPVFCGSLDLKSPYEYFERRFNTNVRFVSSFIYILHTLFFMPVALLAISLALNHTTGVPLTVCSSIIGGICIFYTMLGGFSSVIWTDTIQAILMLCSTIFILIMGIYKVGSLEEIWKRAGEGHRTELFDMNPTPFKRLTFWSALIGMSFYGASHSGCAASSLQRYMSLKTQKDGKICTFIGATGMCTIITLTCMIGLNMYALYYNCDPVANKQVPNANQLISLFVADTVGHIPGFSGLFYAGVLSAGLSTISAELNTVAGLIYYDFIQKNIKQQLSEERGAKIMKITVLINGIYYLIVTPAIQNSPYILQLGVVIAGVTYGVKLGIMILGTTFPKANSIGAIVGAIIALLVTGWFSIGSLIYNVSAEYVLPVSTTNCTNAIYVNTTITNVISEPPLIVYKLSMFYYPLLGSLTTIIIGILVSYLTGPTNIQKIDPRLLIPCVRPCIRKQIDIIMHNK